tara:strand:+ start:472 stop:756 length:285 start_codon:yes stop_codon:yes gene_type:complete
MNDKELEKLADLVAEKVFAKLLAKQQEWDEKFSSEIESIKDKSSIEIVDEKDIFLVEIARLMKLLEFYEDAEQYNKAAIVHNKIKLIKDKLNKL